MFLSLSLSLSVWLSKLSLSLSLSLIESSRTCMEFSVDGNLNGEVDGNSAELEDHRVNDENETGGSSVEGAFQQDQDDKMNQDFSGMDIVPNAIPSVSMIPSDEPYEHTHPLTPGKGRRDCIYDQYPNEHDKIRELSQQLAIEKKRAATYKRHLEMIFEHIDEHNESLSKKIQYIVDNVKEMETKEQQNQR
ncbi:hypothetical protein CMV_028527 [Castanea mollissima]|uniref:Uncharacterized protein n=1 Tax=Castanea mollissima TaxID=60419 RepID=A0A8J4Q4S6_9ROSI|nr:hypothetical protein CMV_028527 [Castanea mollissima]